MMCRQPSADILLLLKNCSIQSFFGGYIYEGEVQNAVAHGQGKKYFFSGKTESGVWKNGILMKSD
jgi:hypothetical protein